MTLFYFHLMSEDIKLHAQCLWRSWSGPAFQPSGEESSETLTIL